MDDVKITRKNGDTAIFQYKDSSLGGGMNLHIGPEMESMTDLEILEAHNEIARKIKQAKEDYEHVAIEIPHGAPQIKYSEQCRQWTARGDVLRCYIDEAEESDEEGDPAPVIEIDDQRLTLKEFGRLLTTYSGWGMRIIIVPDDRLLESPEIRVQDPFLT
jgi:uncharacterized protein YdcH (DUF465 family)